MSDPLQDPKEQTATESSSEEKKSANEPNPVMAGLGSGWHENKTPAHGLFADMLAAKVVRPDLVPDCTRRFIAEVMGEGFVAQAGEMDLQNVVVTEMSCESPLLMVCRPGYDPSGQVDALAREMNRVEGKDYASFAM